MVGSCVTPVTVGPNLRVVLYRRSGRCRCRVAHYLWWVPVSPQLLSDLIYALSYIAEVVVVAVAVLFVIVVVITADRF